MGGLPQGNEKRHAVRSMFDTIAPRYDLVNRVMTFRMDVGWRRETVRSLRVAPGSTVIDVACGTGDLCRDLTAHGLRPVGLDISSGMLAAARTDAALAQADALSLPVASESAEGLTCGFALRNLVELKPFFSEAARVLRPGGRIALLEVSRPANPFLRLGHSVYFSSMVPLIGAALSDASAYRYLPRSAAYLPSQPELTAMAERAGFAAVTSRPLSGGISQLITATRKRPTRR